jgi:alkanesulfonate monooxygenase SsuD/methylene tetrahydromethanopterin reductase-like flavin-dependent oxidoreductase (luciferase family)
MVGGHSPAALRRAARHGNGWYGWRLEVEAATQAVAALDEAARTMDRPAGLGPLEISITPPGPVDLDTARRYAESGVHRLVLTPNEPGAAAIETLIRITAENLIGRL